MGLSLNVSKFQFLLGYKGLFQNLAYSSSAKVNFFHSSQLLNFPLRRV